MRPGDHLAIVDQHAPTDEDRLLAKHGVYATRPLSDGRTFTIVKAFYDLAGVHDQLARLGFEVAAHKLDDLFFLLSARRGEQTDAPAEANAG